MAEEQNGADAPAQPRMQILTQFVRDLSFENVAVQKGLNAEGKTPEIKIQVNLDAKNRGESRFEVAIKLNAISQIGEEKVFILEVDYAGLFLVQNVPEEQMHPFLMIECPRQIFPYLRRIVGDVTRDGGFPPLNLEPIDFMALYRANLAQRQAQAAQETAAQVPN